MSRKSRSITNVATAGSAIIASGAVSHSYTGPDRPFEGITRGSSPSVYRFGTPAGAGTASDIDAYQASAGHLKWTAFTNSYPMPEAAFVIPE